MFRGIGDQQQQHDRISTKGGKLALILAARPWPVTRPMRAHMACTRHQREGQRHGPQHVQAELRAGLE